MLRSKVVFCVLQVLQKVNWNLLERQVENGNAMKKILSLLTTILLFTACSQEELGAPFYAGQEVSISAAFSSDNPANNGKQRISGKDKGSKIDLTWDANDQILVTVGDKSAVFTLTSGAGTNNATFMGKMPADGSNFHVSYPIDYTDEVLTNQTYTANGFGKGLMKMSTKIPGTLDDGFMLSADNSLLGLELHGTANVSKIVLTNNDNQKAYTLDCSTQTVNTAEGTLFYIIVPAGTWSKGLTIEVFNSNGALIEKREKTTEAAFIAGQALMMPEVEINDWSVPSKWIGIFSIAKDKHVTFSPGYLQYVQSKDQWLFASNQYYFTGERHYQNGQLADTIMYFGWSGKNSKAPWGISLSTNANDYVGEFLDWGSNSIAGDAPNTWRSISEEEWMYLYQERENAEKLISLGMVESINGLIILPDSWILPAGMHFEPSMQVTTNQYSKQEWSIMENAGAIFLPMTGYFNHKLSNMRHINEEGHVRLNALRDGRQVYSVYMNGKIINSYQGKNENNLHYAFPVRLVHDTIISLPFEPESVDLGLSVKWATCNVGATTPEEYGDYFAWGETEPKQNFSWEIYKWCNGTKSTITKYNATDGLTTLLPADDAAHVNWGGQWRMPTKEELTELREQCTWKWVTINGIKGNKVTGPNGNSIFLPAGGSYNTFDDQLNSVGVHGWIYSSTKSSVDNQAQEMGISSSGAAQTSCSRCLGLNIRPVLPKN